MQRCIDRWINEGILDFNQNFRLFFMAFKSGIRYCKFLEDIFDFHVILGRSCQLFKILPSHPKVLNGPHEISS